SPPPSLIESVVCQTSSYDDESTFTHRSAATAAPRSTAALPVSVRRNSRSGVSRLRAQAVRPEYGAGGAELAIPRSLRGRCGGARQLLQNPAIKGGAAIVTPVSQGGRELRAATGRPRRDPS